MRIWSISDIGLVRHENQDACGTMLIEDYTAAVVCDGMGGTAGGAVASRLAVQTYRQQLEKNLRRHMTAQQLREVSGYAIAAANRAIRQKALEEPSVHSMGTTLVAAIVSGEDVLISNVGDSRAYLLGSGGIQQISKDHSLVGSMVEQGNMTEQEARRHPNRNLITRASRAGGKCPG
ncbi:MAG: protein phosphatase 2C domain-containing protein [Oscillospiraceae bacterium]